ncbi:MAG: DUF2059 domain-containing protein [Azoarcus sp.]|jgi:hypothetical protein|nr:DUF2059 domain-containing protein [Azoarcus sp.]
MKFCKALIVLFALSIAYIPAKAEELTPEKRADIEQLLTMTGALSLGKQMSDMVVSNMIQTLKEVRPDIPEKALNVLPAEIAAVFDENMGALMELTIPLYHKYFTAAEVKEMIRFYSTDLGKKTIRLMPALMQEAMVVGQQWGKSFAPQLNQRIMEKLKQQGINL